MLLPLSLLLGDSRFQNKMSVRSSSGNVLVVLHIISRRLHFDLAGYLTLWYAILTAPLADAPYRAALSKD
jgi:hypothetical protein